MTETVKEKERPAFDPALLPEEERDIFEKQLEDPRSEEEKALIDGDIKQDENLVPPEFQMQEDLFEKLGRQMYRHYAKSDTYYIEMTDGTTIKYNGLFPSESEYEDLEDMRACIIDGTDMDGKRLKAVEQRHFYKLWMDKLGEAYLFNTKTKKPMTRDERRNVKHHYVINGILKSKLLRSNNDNGPIGKN